MTADGFRRKLISSERLWLAMERDWIPMNYFFILEGKGKIDIDEIKAALRSLVKVYPICCSRIVREKDGLYWEQTDEIPQCIDMGEMESGQWPSDREHEIYCEHFDLKSETPVRIYLSTDKDIQRIYFKVHHTTMDGIGWRIVMRDFFRLLNDKAPIGPSDGPETRYELYEKTLEKDFFEKRNLYMAELAASQAKEESRGKGSKIAGGAYVGRHMIYPPSKYGQVNWVSILIPEDKLPIKRLNGRLISIICDTISDINPELGNRKFLGIVPVDIRYLMPGLEKASNLTGAVAIELDRFFGLPYSERITAITDDIRDKIGKGMAISKHPPIADRLPINIIGWLISAFNRVQYMRKKSPYYFYFSNIGRFSLVEHSTPGFSAQRMIALPILQPYCPFFTLFNTHDNGTDVIFMTDTDNEGLKLFVEKFNERLKVE